MHTLVIRFLLPLGYGQLKKELQHWPTDNHEPDRCDPDGSAKLLFRLFRLLSGSLNPIRQQIRKPKPRTPGGARSGL